MRRVGLAIWAIAALAGCTKEARIVASDQPQTAPRGPADPRAGRYEDNYWQVSQGGRYFTWYGCGNCHGPDAHGVAKLDDGLWRHGGSFAQLHASITAHPGFGGDRIPAEQLWQIAAYLRDAAKNDAAKNRRSTLDQQGEPQGPVWNGPLR